LIAGNVLIMETDPSFTGTVNIGNPVEFKIIDLALIVLEMTGSKSELIFKPLPQDDPKQRKPDITLAQKALSWTPKIGLKEGLSRTIHYFEKILIKSNVVV